MNVLWDVNRRLHFITHRGLGEERQGRRKEREGRWKGVGKEVGKKRREKEGKRVRKGRKKRDADEER